MVKFSLLISQFFRYNRPTRGGSVFLAVHLSLSCYKLSTPSHLEIVSVVVGTESPIIMCVVYIPPNSSYELYLQVFQYLESIISQPRTIIVGDFNLPNINWSNLSGHSPQSTAL